MQDIIVQQATRSYVIRFESEHALIYSRLYGFFDVEFEQQYHRDFFRMLEMCSKTAVNLLVDTRDYPPQSKDVQEIRQQIIHKLADYHVLRLAYIVDNALSRLQSKRLTRNETNIQIALFDSESEAREWLEQ